MAELTVVFWRDIPAQVIVKAGRKTARRQLSERFEQAIDRAAMRGKLTGTDAYLEQVEFVEAAGSQAIVMASRQLAAVARGTDDYLQVY